MIQGCTGGFLIKIDHMAHQICQSYEPNHTIPISNEPRMKRYFAPKQGSTAASAAALEMFKDKNKRIMDAPCRYESQSYIYIYMYVHNIYI